MTVKNTLVWEFFYGILAFILFYFGVKLIKWFLIDITSGLIERKSHSWASNPQYSAQFCSFCEVLVPAEGGLLCDSCGIYIHPKCCRKIEWPCKAVTLTTNQPVHHHWVRAPIKSDSVCYACEEPCDGKSEESGVFSCHKCCWCLRAVHVACKANIAQICDFGVYKHLIIPPNCIEMVRLKNRFRRRLLVKSISAPPWSDWTPLFVLANSKSGSKDGKIAISKFRSLLNPAQVVDLSDRKPDVALECLRLLPEVQCRIIVAGGDGTVSWILNTIHQLKLPKPPAVAILPLGTGNDLSRVLNWGPGQPAADLDPQDYLKLLKKAEPVMLDRWSVKIQPTGRHVALKPTPKELFMYNYMGFGVDAQVALSFHQTRQSRFYLFNSRIFNKLLYVCFGTAEIIEQSCQGLQDRLELYLDNKKIDLPSIEGIVILNIDSFGAGVKLWSMANPEDHPSNFADRKLEVVAFYNSLHMGGLQMGVGQPYVVGQAKNIRVVLHGRTPVQVDGEPWELPSAEFMIKHVNQSVVLRNTVC